MRKLHGKCMVTVGSNEAVMLAAAGNSSFYPILLVNVGSWGGSIHIHTLVYIYISTYPFFYLSMIDSDTNPKKSPGTKGEGGAFL